MADFHKKQIQRLLDKNNLKHRTDDKQRETSGELDFTEKIKAFRALISPSKHDISNQKLKIARRFSDDVQEVGSQLKFVAKSPARDLDSDNNLDELQITHDADIDELKLKFKSNIDGFGRNQSERFEKRGHGFHRMDGYFENKYEADDQDFLYNGHHEASERIRSIEHQLIKNENPEPTFKTRSIKSDTTEDRENMPKLFSKPVFDKTRKAVIRRHHQSKPPETPSAHQPQTALTSSRFDPAVRTEYFNSTEANDLTDKSYANSPPKITGASSFKKTEINNPERTRPRSVVEISKEGRQKLNSLIRPQSSLAYSETSGHYTGVPHPTSSLKTHLNALGDSLSSLSSKLLSGSDSDLRNLARSPSTVSTPRNLAELRSNDSLNRPAEVPSHDSVRNLEEKRSYDSPRSHTDIRYSDSHADIRSYDSPRNPFGTRSNASPSIPADLRSLDSPRNHADIRSYDSPRNPLGAHSHDAPRNSGHRQLSSPAFSLSESSVRSRSTTPSSLKQTNVKSYDPEFNESNNTSQVIMNSQTPYTSRTEPGYFTSVNEIDKRSKLNHLTKKVLAHRGSTKALEFLQDRGHIVPASQEEDSETESMVDERYTSSSKRDGDTFITKPDQLANEKLHVRPRGKVISRNNKRTTHQFEEGRDSFDKKYVSKTRPWQSDHHMTLGPLEKHTEHNINKLESPKHKTKDVGEKVNNKRIFRDTNSPLPSKMTIETFKNKLYHFDELDSSHRPTSALDFTNHVTLETNQTSRQRPRSALDTNSKKGNKLTSVSNHMTMSTNETCSRQRPRSAIDPSSREMNSLTPVTNHVTLVTNQKSSRQRPRSALDTNSRVRNTSTPVTNHMTIVTNQTNSRQRPRSALETDSRERNIQTPPNGSIHDRNQLRRDLSSVDSLALKVEKLHREVSERLGSQENLAHAFRSSPVGRSHVRNDSLSDTSTLVSSSDGEDSLISESGRNGSKKFDSAVFLTSTPLKLPDKTGKALVFTQHGHAIKRPKRQLTEKDQITDNEKDADSKSLFYEEILNSKSRNTPDFLKLVGDRTHTAKYDFEKKSTSDSMESLIESFHSDQKLNFVNHAQWRRLKEQFNASPGNRSSPAEMLLGHINQPGTVKLLQMLYLADPVTRQIIMTKVEVFKAWQQFAIYSREQRKKKQALTRQALSLYVSRSLSNYFTSWKHRAKHSRQVRLADQLFHTHMLTKGFRALQWSLSQSKHQYEKLQTKVNTVMVKATFFKWLTKARKQRRERIENALKRWRLFVMDTQKIRHMRQVVNSHIILCVIRWWNQLYHKKRKQNLAGTFYRSKLLKYSMKLWKQFVVCCKVKARKKAMAISHHNHVTLYSTFTVMKDSFCKARKANQHFWHHYMTKILKAWKAACQVCLVEREADMAKSKEHWDKKTVQSAFFQWHEMLLICKARRIYNFKTYRKSFTIWFSSWKENIAYRQKMELMIQRKQMHRALLTWRQNVVQIKRRHRAAILLLESCHLKQTWKTWLTFTIARKIIKKKILDHILIYKRKKMVSCFSLWRDSFLKKQEEENAKRVWSEACVRKLAFRWRHICHKRKLSKIYKDTQPLREHRKCQIIFHQWLCSLERLQKENEEAKAKEKMLQLSLLQRKFRLWQTETQRVLRIKPMVLQRQQQFCLLAFLSWRKLVQQKTLCKQRKQVQQLSVLRSSFLRWKRQLYIHQVENKIKQRISQGLLLVLIDGWKYFIFRKKKGQNFRDKMLVKRMFYFWKEKANSLSNQRIMDEEERENNMELQRWCFSQWLENVRTQVHMNELHVSQIFQGHNDKHLNKAFCTWRRQMQSTLIARAYHKSLQQRVLVTLFSAWREVTSQSMTDAVHIFSEKIGLQDAVGQHQGNSEEHINIGNDLTSPINSTHLADSETDRYALLSGGLQASMQHRVSKCHRLKSHVTQVITRLRHWPLCVAFDQWREFTEREVQLKSAAASVRSRHSSIQVLLAFREWKQSYLYNTRAQSFRDAIIKRSVLEILYRHREDKKYKKNLSKTAMNHCMKITFNKYFPLWLEKAQDLRQKKHILLLWSTRTAEEMELLPLETHLTKQLRQRSLNLYFSIWALKYRAATKIRQVYHQSLLKWVFTAWTDWAKENHCMTQKCQSLLHTRRSRMAFSKWCERLKLFREVDRHHKQAWHNYLHFILLSWRTWAKSNQQLHSLKHKFIKQNCSKNLITFFYFWKSVTEKLRQAQRQWSQKHQHR
ncbi:uncharacterized protein LOC131930925 [Physella acuta]|uniref:uncharacterized protein LOC131930925 n=1 Tax=Physella acuta TaxID=109671 RepID=UPI0027DC26B3|nr:uncharacterized protein LOC131930925 [Physella acuta]